MRPKTLNFIVHDRADWLVDAVACATQDRRYLRGEPEEDTHATAAIYNNGRKAIEEAFKAAASTAQPDSRDEALKLARDALAKAEHELTVLNNLRATDLTVAIFNAHLDNGVKRDKLEWMTDTTAVRDLVSDAWLAVDAAIEATK